MRLSLTNLVCVLFDPSIPTSFFNFVFILVYYYSSLPTLIIASTMLYLLELQLAEENIELCFLDHYLKEPTLATKPSQEPEY